MVRLSSSLLAFSSCFLAVAGQSQRGLVESLSKIPKLTFVYPGKSGYANASQAFNRRFTVDPAAITFPTSAAQVSSIVMAAVENHYHVVARSGGHSYIANGLGGKNNSVVVDLRNMTSITVDRNTEHAIIQTGNRLGSIALGLHAEGRALPHGVCPYVGIGGHAGHGGFGFASRMWGLTLDNVISADVVLADGELVTASESKYSDLFWAIRGSSSSYGIVTSYTVKTYKEPSFAKVYNFTWQLGYEDAARALEAWQTYVQSDEIPSYLGAYVEFRRGPAKGKVTLILWGVYYGPNEPSLHSDLQSFFSNFTIPPLVTTMDGDGTYIDAVRVIGRPFTLDNVQTAPEPSETFYVKSLMVPTALSHNTWTSFTKYLANQGFDTELDWFMQAELYGGTNSTINKPPLDSTSFGYRNTLFTLQLYTLKFNHLPPFPQDGYTFIDGVADSITKTSTVRFGAYLNYIDDRLPEASWPAIYYNTHYPRLQSIKRDVDPKNTFRFPLSVKEP